MHVIDRRRDPGGKSLVNRQRFLRRARALVRAAVHDASRKRSVKDVARGGEVIVPADGVSEPSFHRSRRDGKHEHILPGNERYVQGDVIPRPPSGEDGSGASADGDFEDEFRFALTDEEFLDLFLEDLELPDLAKRQVFGEEEDRIRPAGFRASGPPPSVSIPRTMRNSLSRRIALKRPRPEEIETLIARRAELESQGGSEDELASITAEIERLERRAKLVPFIDPIDLRFRRHETEPKPVARAVMFCLMDVSGSMDEHMKDLAKRFYSLLYLFLTRRYKHVAVVFIRHTHEAKEVDEETFFYSRESGGTIVSTALEEMARIVHERFPTSEWNIYSAQASDGDNLPNDNARTTALLENVILPLCQYYAYIEVGHGGAEEEELRGASSLWRAYRLVSDKHIPIAMRKVRDRREIFPVFRELFARRTESTGQSAAP